MMTMTKTMFLSSKIGASYLEDNTDDRRNETQGENNESIKASSDDYAVDTADSSHIMSVVPTSRVLSNCLTESSIPK